MKLDTIEYRQTAFKYATSLAKKHTSELGFLPFPAYEAALDENRLWLQYENDEPCGYLLFGLPTRRVIHVTQTVIQTDARRIKNATQLITNLKAVGAKHHADRIVLRCAADLDANHFWIANGFTMVRSSDEGNKRDRLINLYVIDLPTAQKRLF